MILFLDDNKDRAERFIKFYPAARWVETAQDCIQVLSRNDVELLFLDHDLGGGILVESHLANTGMEVVRWIEEHRPKIKKIYVHSWNISAGPVMTRALRTAGYNADYMPFGKIFPDYQGL